MSHLGMGVHITPPQPLEEAIAWHTVPAQLSALRKMLRDADTLQQAGMGEVSKWLDGLKLGGQAQFAALKGRVIGLGEAQAAAFAAIDEHLDRLDEAQQARLDEERKLTTQRLEAMHDEFEGVQVIQQVAATSLSERLHQLEQSPLKRFWRWLTRPWRRNG